MIISKDVFYEDIVLTIWTVNLNKSVSKLVKALESVLMLVVNFSVDPMLYALLKTMCHLVCVLMDIRAIPVISLTGVNQLNR